LGRFDIVSSFGFRASNLRLCAPSATQDRPSSA
jgi:hypothetical protein